MHQEIFDFGFMHKKLQALMQQELCALRNILDLLKEEELAYLSQDITDKKNLFLKKSESNKELKRVQKERNAMAKTLAQSMDLASKRSYFTSSFFNQLLTIDQENSVETLHLRDQILHFMKTIRSQKERLTTLKKQTDLHPCFIPSPCPLRKAAKKPQQIQTLSLESSHSQET